MVLHPQPTSSPSYKVVGEAMVHGLFDGSALLGPLSAPWITKIHSNDVGLFTEVSYFNSSTQVTVYDDPRLPPLSDDWTIVESDRTAEDPRVFKIFRNTSTGVEMREDPRMSVDNLRKRGVNLTQFYLV